MSPHVEPDVERAKDVLRGLHVTPEDALALAKRLQRQRRFGYARKVIGRVRREVPDSSPLRLELAQQHALCTYKDPDLPADFRLERARKILHDADDPATSASQETLGIAGAIEKRQWEVDGRLQHLERSLAFYLRGYRLGVESDYGYTAINAAYVFDLLASQERAQARRAGSASEAAEARAARAREIRTAIVDALPPLLDVQPQLASRWWFLATLAEAHLGLEQYAEARSWLQRAAALEGVLEWERESTARQLAGLALLLEDDPAPTLDAMQDHPAREVLGVLFGDHLGAVRSAFLGKVGLALSGGGFRASLFHIGVLARLAELDVLRHVEAISCVSGGSIIGAHFYLEVRKLLQSRRDQEITRDDYVDIVQRVADDFLAGVQTNIRTRIGAELLTNLKMIVRPHYSRTQRAGELYEEKIYSRVKDGLDGAKRYMDDLLIQPAGDEWEDFEPRRHNWLRQAKVPVLVLNATTLNTGHNWQFTATWMGEPPGGIDTDVDGNDRLRRMYYREAPPRHRRVRLGHAVAASACVPGIFDPLELPGLYPERTVRLVDGGVHDNQGIAALLEQECTVVLVSDASGQMSSQNEPSAGMLGVPLRSNDILMARVREAQFQDLDARRRTSLLRGMAFLHLKLDLPVQKVDWLGCAEPNALFGENPTGNGADPLTRYGVPKTVQQKLAAVRTDLDSFCDLEAYALMTSGYRMAGFQVPRCLAGFPLAAAPPVPWKFLAVEEPLKQAAAAGDEEAKPLRILACASGKFFKIWQLLPALRWLGILLGVAALVGVVWAYFEYRTAPIEFTLGWVMLTLGITIAGLLLGRVFRRTVQLLQYRKTLSRALLGVGMALAGWLVARLHLHLFDRLYLAYGSVDAGEGIPARRLWWPLRGVRSGSRVTVPAVPVAEPEATTGGVRE
jgi:predicted acylesterase/phospholipase RssA